MPFCIFGPISSLLQTIDSSHSLSLIFPPFDLSSACRRFSSPPPNPAHFFSASRCLCRSLLKVCPAFSRDRTYRHITHPPSIGLHTTPSLLSFVFSPLILFSLYLSPLLLSTLLYRCFESSPPAVLANLFSLSLSLCLSPPLLS